MKYTRWLGRAAALALAGLAACGTGQSPPGAQAIAGDAQRGKIALQQYACTACHSIPGVVGATSPLGPPLEGIAKRTYLSGGLPNTPENMIRWLKNPQEIAPSSAMPDLDVTHRDARDMAAYLYTLD